MSALLMVLGARAAEPPPKIDTPIETRMQRSVDAAVVIGNEEYAFLPPVDFALRDAEAVYETFLQSMGIPSESILLLKGANRDQILSALEDASERVGDDGRVWVYFAGHGAASPATGELMLVGDDAKRQADVFTNRSVPISDLTAAVDAPVTLILDTCYAGYSRSGEQLLEGTRFTVADYDAVAAEDAVTLWTAAHPDEVSGPYAAARHGLFTYLAMGAVRGWADGAMGEKADGVVTLEEAQTYVTASLATLQVTTQAPSLATPEQGLVLTEGRQLEAGPRMERLARPSAVELVDFNPTTIIPPIAQDVAWPITRVKGTQYEDANNVTLHLKQELMPIAEYDVDGRDAIKGFRRAPTVHAVGLPFALISGYTAYLYGWDYLIGNTQPAYISGPIAGSTALLTAGLVTWSTVRVIKRQKQRQEILDASNRVVRGEAR